MKQTPDWTAADSAKLYNVDRWSQGLFAVNESGHVCMRADGDGRDIDLKELVEEIRMRGLSPPVLIRFTDILRHRLDALAGAFARAAGIHGYTGAYRGVYPIKVNQHRHVLEDLISVAGKHHFGLEVGSKAELLLGVAYLTDSEALIVCNGFKDRDYIETALTARRLGQRIFLVVEKPRELDLIIRVARAMEVEPLIGVRMKLSSSGGGKWAGSSGDRSKFGLRAAEIVDLIRTLRKRKMLQHLQLLHFHIGSQVSDIQWIKGALREASTIFAELCRMGAPISHVDVGGGLAVDYDGSHTNYESSANYTVNEYASDVVEAFALACEEWELSHPTLISESGRFVAAYHSVLVVEALAAEMAPADLQVPVLPRRVPRAVRKLAQISEELRADNVQETYHRAVEARREAFALFNTRQLSLENHARVERSFRVLCHRISECVREMSYVPDELAQLSDLLAVTYYCNFSLFQSAPDHWAVEQLFPVMPLHRLNERPIRQAVIADITCDSDGAMDRFIDLEDVSRTLPLHDLREDEPYYLGIFLVGAYQEVLGDLHNLFGDTHAVHVSSGATGYVIDRTDEGDSIVDVLTYLQYTRRQLLAQLRRRVETSLNSGAMNLEHAATFMRNLESRLDDYTYLRPSPSANGKRAARKPGSTDESR